MGSVTFHERLRLVRPLRPECPEAFSGGDGFGGKSKHLESYGILGYKASSHVRDCFFPRLRLSHDKLGSRKRTRFNVASHRRQGWTPFTFMLR